jgi:hypothetical protein
MEHKHALKRGNNDEQRRFEELLLCIQGMPHGVAANDQEEGTEVDPKQADKGRSKHVHARYHKFLKGELDDLLMAEGAEARGKKSPKPGGPRESDPSGGGSRLQSQRTDSYTASRQCGGFGPRG